MDVGMMMVFASYGWDGMADDQVWDEEIALARLAADLGFDVLWSAEHHFFDYSFCPDNIQLMTYLTAKCPNIDVGTAAVILPWHDPLRVAEQAAVLDLLCEGRLRFGMGRGLARREFTAFRGTHGRKPRPLRRGGADDRRRAAHRLHRGQRARSTRSPASRSARGRSTASTAASTPWPRARTRVASCAPSSARTW